MKQSLDFFSPAKKRTSHQDCGLKCQTMANPLHIDADVVFHCKNKIDVCISNNILLFQKVFPTK